MKNRVLILAGDGLNCEAETATAVAAFEMSPVIRHVNDVIADRMTQEELEKNYAALVIPGGFSFGDEWGSGRLLALKIRDQLKWDLRIFAQNGGWVLGVCNGFQTLIRLGVFGKNVSITHNDGGRFIDRWVRLRVSSDEGWLEGGDAFDLPIRHGEGRLVVDGERSEHPDVKIALTYETCPNGSWKNAAGLSAESGRILGLMPHPEAALRRYQVPGWTEDRSRAWELGPGAWIFKNLQRHWGRAQP